MRIWEYIQSNDITISGPDGHPDFLDSSGAEGANSEIISIKRDDRGLVFECKLKNSAGENKYTLRFMTDTGETISDKLSELSEEIIGKTISELRNEDINI